VPPINLNETVRTLDGGRLRVLQIIPLVIAGAVAAACAAAIALHIGRTPNALTATYEDISLVTLLSLIHLILAAALFAAAFMLYVRRVAPRPGTSPTVEECLRTLRSASILRLSLLEMPALFGVLICIVASQRGVLDLEPLYWLNLASAAAFLVITALTFPTRDRVTLLLTAMMSGTGA
jgi:hypothetical protein